MTKTMQSPTRLLLKAFRNIAIIFKIFLLFYLLLNLIILSKNIYFLNLYIILLLSRASHGHNIYIYIYISYYHIIYNKSWA